MKLLIVEDNRSQASLLCRAFTERGHVVDACDSGEFACQRAQRGAYDVVLLDWNLPGLDGVTVCRELRRVGNTASVLMVSVRSDVADKVLLAFLMRRAGETVSRSDIISHVWSALGDLGSNVIDVYVRRLRGKLGPAGRCLKTVRGIGYRLDADDLNEEN
jgi:DNA-binding response OmpR family regulator